MLARYGSFLLNSAQGLENHLKVGDMVKAAYVRSGHAGVYHTGVVVEMEEVTDLFSEKYAILETNTYVRVLVNGQVMTFDLDEDEIEVINESNSN